MSEEHLILCGGLSPGKPMDAKIHNLQVGKDKRKGQIYLDIDSVTEKMVQDLPHVLHDLLEIATYVYVGDQVISRGGLKQFDYGEKWNRCLHYEIPVRENEIWSNSNIKGLLEYALSFASGDTLTFSFAPKPKEPPGFLNFRTETEPEYEYNEVLLFSGGLDSFTGAVEEVLGNMNHPILVSHQSNNKLVGLQRKLHEYILGLCEAGRKPFYVPVKINKDKRLTRDTSQRSRSFLYASLGAIVANIFGLSRVKFYENGIVSCNLPFDGQTLQARSTRVTHPKFLHLLSELVSEVMDSDFHFENPYFLKTKTDICERLKELSHERYISETRSCAKSVYRNPNNHCGTCSQCIDRRFATLAAGCEEYDPEHLYALDVFKEHLDSPHDKAMAAGFVGFANNLEIMTVDGFVQKFSSDVHEIARYMPNQKHEIALKSLFDLHHRHAVQVNRVMEAKLKQNVSSVMKGVLPATCLVSMVARGEHQHIEKLLEADKSKDIQEKKETEWKIKPVKERKEKDRPTKAEMDNRNRAVLVAALEIEKEYGRLPTVNEINRKTGYTADQIYATAPYKEGKIAKRSARLTPESTGSSVSASEQFGEKSIEHSRANRLSKSEQLERDKLIDESRADDVRDEKQHKRYLRNKKRIDAQEY